MTANVQPAARHPAATSTPFHPLLARVLPACVAGVALLAAASHVMALSPDWSDVDDARLETLFWDCDARALVEALPAGDGALCAMATDELKQRRFGGDFHRLLAWWQSRREAERTLRGVPPEADASSDNLAEAAADGALETP